MIRGTTPTLEFALPFEVDLIAEAYVYDITESISGD